MIEQLAPPALLNEPSDWPAQGDWTYEDYLRLPDDGNRYEIIEGVLYVTNAPAYDHQYAVMQFMIQMGNFVIQHKLGVVITAPFEVHLAENTRPVQPDVLFIRAEKQPAPGAKYFEGAPDLIVEVLSPASLRTDRLIKLAAYEQAGVAEYWLADPKTRAVEVYCLTEGEYNVIGQFTAADPIESKVLAGLTIQTDSVFA